MLPRIKAQNFIEEQGPLVRKKLEQIRSLILSSNKNIEENYSPNLPYYSLKGLLCTIIVKKGTIIVSFSNGAILAENHSILVGAGLKIREIRVSEEQEIPTKELKEILMEAVNLNLA